MIVPLTKSDEKGSQRGLQTVTAQAVTTNYFQESQHELELARVERKYLTQTISFGIELTF